VYTIQNPGSATSCVTKRSWHYRFYVPQTKKHRGHISQVLKNASISVLRGIHQIPLTEPCGLCTKRSMPRLGSAGQELRQLCDGTLYIQIHDSSISIRASIVNLNGAMVKALECVGLKSWPLMQLYKYSGYTPLPTAIEINTIWCNKNGNLIIFKLNFLRTCLLLLLLL